MSTTHSPAVAGKPPAAGAPAAPKGPPSRDPIEFAAPAGASAVLLIAYFVLYQHVIDGFESALRALLGYQPEPAVARVIAVTLLGILLVAVWWRVVRSDPRFHAPILITYILAVGNATYGILDNHHSELLSRLTGGRMTEYSPTFVAILATLAIEMVLSRLIRGKWPHLSSAYISGISVGILIKSPELWPYVLCGLISIASKYALRYRGRHLWNPSNFGVVAMLFLASQYVASLSVQSGNNFWPVLLIWALGSLILYRLGRLHIPVVFLAAFVPLAFLRAWVSDQPWQAELAPITWPMFQLYIFFMITDPGTTTRRRWSQCAVAVLVAIVETILRLAFRDVHSLYHALFIVAPITNLWEIVWDSRHAAAKQQAAAVGKA
jgi:enediyne biosynthesis protein E5